MPTAPLSDLSRYYETVAPFYGAEMAVRTDLALWRDVVARTGARSVIDLGCGDGRVARAIAGQADVVGIDLLTSLLPADPSERGFEYVQTDMRELPFGDGRFDLAIAANDPFAHLLEDADRTRAIDEALRVAGRLVIDGLSLTAADDARARAAGCVRECVLPDKTVRHETWHSIGGHRYRTTYRYLRGDTVLAEASTDVRAWTPDEPALQGRAVRIFGGLDGRAHDLEERGFVIGIGGPL
jgi:SAM-dependent methyltransferase